MSMYDENILVTLRNIERHLGDISLTLSYQFLLNTLRDNYQDGLLSKDEYLEQCVTISDKLANR